MSAKHLALAAFLGLAATVSTPAGAEVDVRALARALSHDGALAETSRFSTQDLSAIVELPEGEDGAAWGMPSIGSHFSAVRAPLADLDALARLHPDWKVTWSAPLHPLLDRAALWIHAPSFRTAAGGLSGKGVMVGVVDTGIDARHPDFQNSDGTTRIAYLIDFSQEPVGHYPDAERRCTAAKLKCAVLSAADIDAANKGGPANVTGGAARALALTGAISSTPRLLSPWGRPLPDDTIGHGTHVASLAAGNGGKEGKYVGVAPEASLVVARAIDSSGGIGDTGVLVATSLVFYLAEEEGKKQGLERLPMVVNLSLGSDWGPHDGTTELERGLADLVGDNHPGRAIVVAAGNSAGLYGGPTTLPSPEGIHTDVNVPEGSSVRVPIALPPPDVGNSPPAPPLKATILVWIAFRPEDNVSVGLDRSGAPWIPPMSRGEGNAFGTNFDAAKKPTLSATIANGVRSIEDLGVGLKNDNAAAVIIDGTFPSDEEFAIRLEGHGTASFWIQSEGDLGPESGSLGAQFPGATKESTVTIPAASPALIAVGATLNRTSWTDRVGNDQHIGRLGSLVNPPLDSVAYFSSAGPTSDLRMKPDLVAPGAYVAGAMSRDADPATNKLSIFAENDFCSPIADCVAVDDTHAVTIGTSMAAPLVAGAVALLFEGDPSLTESRILTLLQAGARHPEGLVPLDAQLGAGALDLDGVLEVEGQIKAPEPREPVTERSWLTLGATYAHPDPTFSVPAILQLRDAEGRVTAVDPGGLAITIDRGAVTKEPESPAPGFVRFSVAANRDTGGEALVVEARYRGAFIAEKTLPIAVDVNVVKTGFSARGGCTVARGRAPSRHPATPGALLLIAWQARRRTRAVRTARSRGRTDTSDRGRRDSFPR